MGPALKPERHAFYDRIGQSVQIPRNDTGRNPHPWFDDGYAKALWDFRNDSLLLGDDNRTLYVRDVDRTGNNALLNTWHAISSLETEYQVRQLIVPARGRSRPRIRCRHSFVRPAV